MVYAYDLWAALPTKDLYDSLIMLASINAAKDMYEKADALLKEFNTKYGDFYSPIQKDMEWYKENVTDKAQNLIADLYNRGIDPLRSSQGRAALSRFINSVPVGTINQLKLSAADANEYLKNKALLEAAGRYNADLEERFLGNNMQNWSTVENGMWTRTSPTEMKTLKEATEPWYNNRTAGLLSKGEVEDFGLAYDPRNRYYGFSRKSLSDIAAQQTPGWNDTVYSRYYRDIAKQKLIANGVKNPTTDDIEQLLQRDVAQANEEYLIRPKVEADLWALEAQRAANQRALERIRHANAMKERGGNLTDENTGFSFAQRTYDKALANIMSSNGIIKTSWVDMHNNYGAASKIVLNEQAAFGRKFVGNQNYGQIKAAYIKKFSIPINETAVVKWIGAGTVDGNNNVSKISLADVSRFISEDAVVTNTAGYTKKYKPGGKEDLIFKGNVSKDGINTIQDAIEKYGVSNTTATPLGDGYGSARKNSAAVEVYPRMKVTVNCGNGNTITTTCYYDMGLHSESVPGGAYVGNEKPKNETTVFGNVNIIDSREGNYYPNYDDWMRYGVNDVQTNAWMKAKPTEGNIGY